MRKRSRKSIRYHYLDNLKISGIETILAVLLIILIVAIGVFSQASPSTFKSVDWNIIADIGLILIVVALFGGIIMTFSKTK